MTRMAFAPLLFAAATMAEQPAINGKPDFSGTWRQDVQGANSKETHQWVIEQVPDKILLRELDGDQKTETDLQCSVKAEECSGKVNGRKAKVVFYFNGPMLVEISTAGSNITKTRRTLSPDGQKMTVEIMPMAPYSKPEKITLVRSGPGNQNAAAAVQ